MYEVENEEGPSVNVESNVSLSLKKHGMINEEQILQKNE